MGIAKGMKDIVQDIVSSHDVRVAELRKSKDEVKEMLGSFHASHKKMGTQLRGDLAQDKAKAKSKVKAMRNGFQTEHKEMRSALRKDLAGHTQTIRGETAKMCQETRATHKEMSTELKRSLAQGVATRKADGKGMLGDFQRSRKQASTQLRRALADCDRGIKSEVGGMRQETKADLKEARTSWQGMAQAMEAKRAEVKAPPKEEKVEVPVAEEEIPDLEAKLLTAVGGHPEGITLAGAAVDIGITPQKLTRAAKSLVEKGKIRKEDKFYFALGTE
ncbi:MAG: hypothetical protein COX52_06530 [Syntrophobacterales bacterium CG23_combo_of_CG06-09_8_20_14_all_48_27]|nr:MAG: hypothetical protein COX52_06530 [Syntrophobacterales bacterium CG23_combo_of_CG06-09_8_20_14_all_48_27]